MAALALISEGSPETGDPRTIKVPEAALNALSRQFFRRGIIRDLDEEVLASRNSSTELRSGTTISGTRTDPAFCELWELRGWR